MTDDVRGIVEGKDYGSIEIVLPFVEAFIDRITGHDQHAYMIDMNTRYSDILNRTSDGSGLSSWVDMHINNLERTLNISRR